MRTISNRFTFLSSAVTSGDAPVQLYTACSLSHNFTHVIPFWCLVPSTWTTPQDLTALFVNAARMYPGVRISVIFSDNSCGVLLEVRALFKLPGVFERRTSSTDKSDGLFVEGVRGINCVILFRTFLDPHAPLCHLIWSFGSTPPYPTPPWTTNTTLFNNAI